MHNLSLTPHAANIVVLDPADPAAGSDWVYLLPDNYYYDIHYLCFHLVTAVAVATRYVFISNYTAGIVFAQVGAPAAQIASLDYHYHAAHYRHITAPGSANLNLMTPWPEFTYMHGGSTLGTVVQNIQGADQITAIHVVLNRWPIRTI
jgi:hypothetical protein